MGVVETADVEPPVCDTGTYGAALMYVGSETEVGWNPFLIVGFTPIPMPMPGPRSVVGRDLIRAMIGWP